MREAVEQLRRYGDMIEATTDRVDARGVERRAPRSHGAMLSFAAATAALVLGVAAVAWQQERRHDAAPRVRTTTPATNGATSPTNTAAAAPAGLLVVGDQVALGARDEIRSRAHTALGAVTIVDAATSRSFRDCVEVVEAAAHAHSLPRFVVVSCSTNGLITPGDLERLVASVGADRQLFLVTPFVARSWAAPDANMIRVVAAQHANVHVMDFAQVAPTWQPAAEFFSPDGFHLLGPGRVRFAELLVNAIRTGAGATPTTATITPSAAQVLAAYLAAHHDVVTHSAVIESASGPIAVVASETDAHNRVIVVLSLAGSPATAIATLALPPPYFAFAAALPIDSADVTGDGAADFLVRVDAAGDQPAVVVSDDGGQWRLVPESGDATDVYLGRSPAIDTGHLTTLHNDCVPDCANGTTTRITWHYDRTLSRLVHD